MISSPRTLVFGGLVGGYHENSVHCDTRQAEHVESCTRHLDSDHDDIGFDGGACPGEAEVIESWRQSPCYSFLRRPHRTRSSASSKRTTTSWTLPVIQTSSSAARLTHSIRGTSPTSRTAGRHLSAASAYSRRCRRISQ